MTIPPSGRALLAATLLALPSLPRDARAGEAVLYDTVAALSAPVTKETAEKKAGWEKAGTAPLRGDAWIENARIAVWLRRAEGRAVLFYRLGGELRECAQVAAVVEASAAGAFTALAPAGEEGGVAAVSAQGTMGAGKAFALRCRVRGDRPVVECIPGDGVARLALAFRSGHAVLPDLFGDDVILRAGESEKPVQFLPGELAVLHPLDRGDALLMCSWAPASKAIAVRAGPGGPAAAFTGCEVPCSGPEPIAVSVLAGSRIWCEVDADAYSPFEHRKMEWTPPFPAQYRCDLRKADGWKLTDSWRRTTTTNREWFSFLNYCFPPLCINGEGVFLRIPKYRASGDFARNQAKEIRYAGPILIYPFNRETEARRGVTPPDAWTVLDVLRDTLGEEAWLQKIDVGEGVLKDSPYPTGFVYIATCGATGEAEKIFSSRKEKEQAETLRRQFDGMRQFVRYNRARIEEYVAFAGSLRTALEDARRANASNPEFAPPLAELDPLVQYIPDLFAASRDTIKTPEHCEGLAAKILELIDAADDKKVEKVKELGKAIRTIGGAQDDMLAAFRMSLKILRQRAALIHAASGDPAVREMMRTLCQMTRTILRIRSPYEGH
jgi:hypothetical protein